MKQNKDLEELFNLCEKYVLDKSQSGAYDLAGYIDEEISELVDFVETHTKKKVEESKTELLEEILGLEGFKEIEQFDHFMALKESRIIEIKQFGYSKYDQVIGGNEKISELKQQIIDYKTKDFKQVSNPLDEDYR